MLAHPDATEATARAAPFLRACGFTGARDVDWHPSARVNENGVRRRLGGDFSQLADDKR
jgi:hypothetical protein